MLHIRDLVGDFKQLSREAFVAKYNVPVLLHQTDQELDVDRDFKSKARRATPRPTMMVKDPRLELEVASDVAGVLVLPLERVISDGPAITVGRTDACDIQLPYDGVSVQHAAFTKGGKAWLLADLGATNGTFVNGERLAPQAPTPIPSGSNLKLGTAEVIFYDPEGFYDYLSGLMAAAR
jgi:pSer/pThr/pTyr-binding forkhead associated (FHA) protein